MMHGRPRLGVSSCLLGRPVRWNGEHRLHSFLRDRLAPFVEFVEVCPEVEMGMETPRPPIQVERLGQELRLRAVNSDEDFTDRMREFAERRVEELRDLQLSGYVLKSRSPSCGISDAKHFENGMEVSRGSGLFADTLARNWPELPLIDDEHGLEDPFSRGLFFLRVFTSARWKNLAVGGDCDVLATQLKAERRLFELFEMTDGRHRIDSSEIVATLLAALRKEPKVRDPEIFEGLFTQSFEPFPRALMEV
ncbi:MAG: DUF523 domain-containing protein [Planctomycetota bacterium]